MLNFCNFFLVLCVVWISTFSTAFGQSKIAGVNDWRHDIDEIVKEIRLLHPEPFTKIGKHAFLREVAAFKEAVPSLTEEQRMVRAMRLVASLGDGHTMLEPNNPAFAYWYPVRIYDFSDGYFVTSAHKSVADLAGAQVLEIAGISADEVINQARTLLSADNAFAGKERLWAVHSTGLMKGLGYASTNGEMNVKFKLRDGKIVVRTLIPAKTDQPQFKDYESRFQWQLRSEVYGAPFGKDEEWTSAYKNLLSSVYQTSDATRPPHLTDRRVLGIRSMPDQDAYYIRANAVGGSNFVDFFQQAMREVDLQKPRRLILDLRYNFGGDGSVVPQMIQEFVKRTDNKSWKELYILTGRKTFSAAIMTVDAFLDNTTATVIGEPTAAGLNHYGDATSRTYDRTKLILYVSTLRHQLSSSDDLTEFIPVDVPAPFSFADYSAGRDPAVDPILRGDDMRSIPVIARADGGAAARKIYQERKARFAKYDWWSPPKEFDLRQACDFLRGQKRTADALETCKLNAEINPYIWNVWFNLAVALRDAGLPKERLASLRCVMEIAPDNWNVPAIKRLMAQPGNEGNELAPGCPAEKSESNVGDKSAEPSFGDKSKNFKPAVVRYGATVAETQTALAGLCKKINLRQINQPFIVLREIVKDKQMQIDCDGFEYFGKQRRAEFVFADDSLEMVWILTEATDENTLLKSMTEIYGEPTHRNDKFIAATRQGAAIRTDRPEVLLYSEKLAPRVLGWFDKNSTFR